MKMTIIPLRHSINRSSSLLALLLIPLAYFALSPQARALCRQGCDLTHFNTFLGADALTSNTTGTENTATGAGALTFNTTGFDNTATGSAALTYNTTGDGNTATGEAALYLNTTGSSNTATGSGALASNTTGDANTAVGDQALFGTIGNNNTAVGAFAGGGGNNNIALGFQAGIAAIDNDISIGNLGGAESGVIRIGTEGTHTATHIAGIRHTPLTNGSAVAVGINADGQLGVRASSARFKDAIKPMDKTSEAIFSLQPVTFRYKKDPAALPQFGLVAEEVAKVNPDLVARDKEGKPFTVRYDEINAMLLNEFLKEHKAFINEHRTVQDLKAIVAQQQKQIEMLNAGLHKMSAQLEMSKTAPQTVLNDQ